MSADRVFRWRKFGLLATYFSKSRRSSSCMYSDNIRLRFDFRGDWILVVVGRCCLAFGLFLSFKNNFNALWVLVLTEFRRVIAFLLASGVRFLICDFNGSKDRMLGLGKPLIRSKVENLLFCLALKSCLMGYGTSSSYAFFLEGYILLITFIKRLSPS